MKSFAISKDTLTFALLVAIATAGLNWLIETGKSKMAMRDSVQTERREELKRELSEFYYPIYMRILEDDAWWNDPHIWQPIPGTNDRELNPAFGSKFEKEVLLPNHVAVIEILNKHMYYLAGPKDKEVRDQLLLYANHVAVYQAARSGGDDRTPYKFKEVWPSELRPALERRINQLQTEYDGIVTRQTGE